MRPSKAEIVSYVGPQGAETLVRDNSVPARFAGAVQYILGAPWAYHRAVPDGPADIDMHTMYSFLPADGGEGGEGVLRFRCQMSTAGDVGRFVDIFLGPATDGLRIGEIELKGGRHDYEIPIDLSAYGGGLMEITFATRPNRDVQARDGYDILQAGFSATDDGSRYGAMDLEYTPDASDEDAEYQAQLAELDRIVAESPSILRFLMEMARSMADAGGAS